MESFLPHINASSTLGPEVLRAGFRIPVNSASLKTNSITSIELSPRTDSTSIKQISSLQESPSRIGSATLQSPNHRPNSTGFREDIGEIRPIFRKGFPGKKSQRAVVNAVVTLFSMLYNQMSFFLQAAYAPDRYELDPRTQLVSKSMTVLPRVLNQKNVSTELK
jgi:hypothetical protein